jgi:hypothetical protein
MWSNKPGEYLGFFIGFCDNISSMNKRLQEIINGLGLLFAAVAMIAVGIGFIFLVSAVFHTNFK